MVNIDRNVTYGCIMPAAGRTFNPLCCRHHIDYPGSVKSTTRTALATVRLSKTGWTCSLTDERPKIVSNAEVVAALATTIQSRRDTTIRLQRETMRPHSEQRAERECCANCGDGLGKSAFAWECKVVCGKCHQLHQAAQILAALVAPRLSAGAPVPSAPSDRRRWTLAARRLLCRPIQTAAAHLCARKTVTGSGNEVKPLRAAPEASVAPKGR
jgi:hypothetical protein